MRTLVIQGDWLIRRSHYGNLKMSVHGGADELYYGGIVGFMDATRKAVMDLMIDKVVVVWDGTLDGLEKYNDHPVLRARKEVSWNQHLRIVNEHRSSLSRKEEHELFIKEQKQALKGVFEGMGIRQMEEDTSESMDGIAHYVNEAVKVGETVVIFAREGWFHQMVSADVSIIGHDGNLITHKDFLAVYGYDHSNELMMRCFTGLPSSVIDGVKGLTMNKMVHYFMGLKLEHYAYDDLIAYARRKRVDVRLKVYDMVLSAHDVVVRNARLINTSDPILNNNLIEQTNYCLYSPLNECNLVGVMEMYRTNAFKIPEGMDIRTYFDPFQRVILKETEYKLFHEQINI